jgi:uncharacterized protein (DUF1800 family)
MTFWSDPRPALIALNRFGLGPKPGDLSAAAADPRGFVLAETQQAGVALLDRPQLGKSSAALKALFADQQKTRAERELKLAQGMASAVRGGFGWLGDGGSASTTAHDCRNRPRRQAETAGATGRPKAVSRRGDGAYRKTSGRHRWLC